MCGGGGGAFVLHIFGQLQLPMQNTYAHLSRNNKENNDNNNKDNDHNDNY